MIKRFFDGVIFGAGFALSLVAIWIVGLYFIAPKILSARFEQQETPVKSITSAPRLPSKKRFLGSPAIHAGDFAMDRSSVLADGPGAIKGKISLNGKPLEGLKLRLALNGSVMSQWAVSNSTGEYTIKVPYGLYRIDGYELDYAVANILLAGKINHPQTAHSSPAQEVDSKNQGYGLNLSFVDPVIKKTKRKYSSSDKIMLSWDPYPNAAQYSVQLFEKKDPNVWNRKPIFPCDQPPIVSDPRMDLSAMNIKLNPGYFYTFHVVAKNNDGKPLSESPDEYNGYDFLVGK